MSTESPDAMTAPRLARIQYYLERRLGKEDRASHIQKRQEFRGKQFLYGTPPIEHHSFGDFVEGITSPEVPPPTTDPIYYSQWNTSVYEETRSLVVTPPGDSSRVEVVADILRARCGFSELQMNRVVNGITETQLRAWEQTVERSRIPLMNSWTEPEILFEIFLATGSKSSSLEEAAFAYYDPTAPSMAQKERPSIQGPTWLLVAQVPNRDDVTNFHCLEVEFRPQGLFGDGKPFYRLEHNNNTYRRSMGDALAHYMRSIDYCNGEGASQAVKVLKPELLG